MTGGEAGEDKGQEGSAQMEEGHASAAKTESKLAAPANQPQGGKKETRERRKPGQADSAHTLGKLINYLIVQLSNKIYIMYLHTNICVLKMVNSLKQFLLLQPKCQKPMFN
jgi:hypothetical protein